MDVDDTVQGVLATAVCVGEDTLPAVFTYSRTISPPSEPATCEDHPNTAEFTTNDSGAADDDTVTVTVCSDPAPLEVSKTASTSFKRT